MTAVPFADDSETVLPGRFDRRAVARAVKRIDVIPDPDARAHILELAAAELVKSQDAPCEP
jgi:hypothetical protein